MSTITADPNMLVVLSQLREPTSVADPQGRVLGIFTPAQIPAENRLFDLEEAERISKEEAGRGRPLREFWADIRAGRPVT